MKKCYACILVLVLLCLPARALSQGSYVFERMWPPLNLSWNFLIPNGTAFDESGNLYVADSKTHRIVKLTWDGFFITWWGGESGEDAEEGKFSIPLGVAVDNDGNVYVSEQGNHRVQKFDSEGNHLTTWGSECALETGEGCVDPDDDGPLQLGDGQFNVPGGLAVDAWNNVYVADIGNDRVQKFDSNGGYILTFEGDFNEPHDVIIDSQNNVYVADKENSRVLKYTLDGIYVEEVPSCHGFFSDPSDLALDGQDNLYIAEQGFDNIQKVDPDGNCTIEWWGSFNSINSIAIDKNGYVYATDADSIQKFTNTGDFIIKWSNSGSENGEFNGPQGVALDTEGFVYVADGENYRIQKFTPDGQYEDEWGDQGIADDQFGGLAGIATDVDNNVYVVDDGNRCIKRFTSEGDLSCKWGEPGDQEGQFLSPYAIAVDGSRNVFVTDVHSATTRIQKFRPIPEGGHCTDGSGYELVAVWGTYYYGPEPLPDDGFRSPNGIAVDQEENVYITDYNIAPRIVKYRYRPTPGGPGGINNSGYEFDTAWGDLGSGPGELVRPWALAVDTEDGVYVTDTISPRVQKFKPTADGTGGIDDSGYVFDTGWGSTGSWAGQFELPRGIAVSANGSKVYVSDEGINRIQVFSRYEALLRPKAIIVAGGGPYDGNSLWDATQATANFAYQTLINRGFTKDDIYYLTSDTDVDMDGNDVFVERDGVRFSDEVYAIPSNESLKQAIIDAVNDDAENLVLYLTDHGNDLNGGTFYLNEHREPLVASDLASWLATLEPPFPGKVVVVYDGCQSESFIDDLSGEDRIIVTSAGQYERAKFLNQGTISFSNFFWTNVFNRFSVSEAYSRATQAVNFYFSNQNPQLSGSAEDVYIEILQGDRGVPVVVDVPTINPDTVEFTINDDSSVDICAYVDPGSDSIARVWAEVQPPSSNLGLISEPLIDQLDTIELILPPGEDCYRATSGTIEDSGFFQVAIYAMDGRGNISAPALNTISLNNNAVRKAIVVGGYDASTDSSMVETNVQLARNALISQGYDDDTADDICFLGTGIDGVDDAPSMEALENCITSYAGINPAEEYLDLVIYLTGEGNPGTFVLNDSNELLSASDLAELLNNLQNSIPSRITLIYDAHYSGSFIPPLVPPLGNERIVITSSGETEEAYFREEGDISFSHFFWGQTSIGATLYDGFAYSKNAISYFSHREEISFSCYIQKGPLLDANGVTPANEAVDYDIARGRTIGMGQVFADEVPPQIGSVSLEETDDGILISVGNIQPPDTIQRVWAEIKPLRYCPETPGVDTGTLAEEVLGPVEGGGYEGTYSGPLEAFKVSVYAMDEDQTVSLPRETRFYQEAGGDIYEPDALPGQANVIVVNHATPQPHDFHDPLDKDWVKFYAKTTFVNPDTGVEEPYTYRIKAGNLGENCKPVIELYHENDTENSLATADTIAGNSVVLERELDEWGDGIYYVKLFHNPQEPYNSGNTDYELQVDNEDAGGLLVLITGRVEDQSSGQGIDGAFITTNDGGASAISVGGRYDLYQKPGTWSLTATANGYQSFGTSITVNTGGGIIPLDIDMPPRATASQADCSEDADCDDGLFCNGVETCVDDACVEGSASCLDDGLYCNGEEVCDEEGDVCSNAGNPCLTNLTCDEANDVCVGCITDADCDDGVYCNGVETCLVDICQAGTDPCPEGIECDKENDVCNMPTVVISPGSLFQSRWMPMLLFLRIQGTDTHFGAVTEVAFNPNSVRVLPMVSNQETMFCLGLLMPAWITGPIEDSITVTVKTDTEEVSGTIEIRSLPFMLKGQ